MALDDKIKKGARNCAIGIGMIVAGNSFDYSVVDDLVNIAGFITTFYNLREGIDYVKHHYRKFKK